MARNDDPVAFEHWYVLVVKDLSVLVKPDGGSNDDAVWLPISQVDVQSGELVKGAHIDFEIPQWLADDRGMG